MTISNIYPLNILVLYDTNSLFTSTVKEYIESFSLFSKNRVSYAVGTLKAQVKTPLFFFDVVVIHYSIRLSYDWFISKYYAEALNKYEGLTILFAQDEYDNTETLRNWIEYLGVNIVFTCVPQDSVESVYPNSRFPNVKFIQTITGFVPIYLQQKKCFKPMNERQFSIGYRGRELPYRYGNLGREKLLIAQKMKQLCKINQVSCDIEWQDSKRVYGQDWYNFMENCKATLGTESGSNIFDDYGEIQESIELEAKINPDMSYEEIHSKYLVNHENKIIMNQISPRIFEAISLKTALVLFEGKYSNIVLPDIHYIPLKKDFSNVDEVFCKLEDIEYISKLTERAYQDIVASGLYSYQNFIRNFDNLLEKEVDGNNNISQLTIQDFEFQYHFTEHNNIKQQIAYHWHEFLERIYFVMFNYREVKFFSFSFFLVEKAFILFPNAVLFNLLYKTKDIYMKIIKTIFKRNP